MLKKLKLLSRTQFVYDFPLRLFHFVFASLFLSTFLITKIIDSESLEFTYHMLLGLLLFAVVLLRILWGIFGTRYSLFSSFQFHPQKVLKYFLGILKGGNASVRSLGHNPASSWASVVMFVLVMGLGVTGFLMTSQDARQTYEDIHELMANAFMIVVIAHVLGIAVHTFRHREIIGLSMIDGKKAAVSTEMSSPVTAKPLVAVAFVALVFGFGTFLWTSYDLSQRSLNLFGVQMQLGENEDLKSDTYPPGDND